MQGISSATFHVVTITNQGPVPCHPAVTIRSCPSLSKGKDYVMEGASSPGSKRLCGTIKLVIQPAQAVPQHPSSGSGNAAVHKTVWTPSSVKSMH